MNLSDIVKLALSCALLAFASTASATTYYVDPVNGDDTRDASVACFESSPWKTITRALNLATNGDMVKLAAGEYLATAETLPMTLPAGVTLQGDGSNATFFKMLSPTATIFVLNNAEGAAIRDLCIRERRGTGNGHILEIKGGGAPLIENVVITSVYLKSGFDAVRVNGASPTFRNCLFSCISCQNVGGGAMQVMGMTSNPTIENCTFASIWNYGLKLEIKYNNKGQVTAFSQATVRDSIFWHNCLDMINVSDAQVQNVRFHNVSQQIGVPTDGSWDIDHLLADGHVLVGCFGDDPVFADDFMLSNVDAGDEVNSPCIDAGSRSAADAGVDHATTRGDGVADSGVVDMGFHYPAGTLATGIDAYVSTSGDDEEGDGSAGNPWRTITKAFASVPRNSTIHVAPGTYSTGETFPLYLTNSLSVVGEDPRTTIISTAATKFRIEYATKAVIRGLTLEGGAAVNSAVNINVGSVEIKDCIFRNNQGRGGDSGAIRCSVSPYVLLDNLLVYGNRSANDAGNCGGISCETCRVDIRNCTVTGNHAAQQTLGVGSCGSGIWFRSDNDAYRCAPQSTVVDTIVYGNNVRDVDGITSAIAKNCCFGDGTLNGTNGCFSADPLMSYGYYLLPGSPCIDAGSRTAEGAGLSDLTSVFDGAPDSGMVDIGFHFPSGRGTDYFVDIENGSDDNAGTNSAAPLQHISTALGKATYGSAVYVAPGVYSKAAGEVLPYQKLDGVCLSGSNYTNTILDAASSGAGSFALKGVARALIEGFTIEHCCETDASSALAFLTSSPLVRNCYLLDNTGRRHGGGLWCGNGSSPIIRNCVFKGNSVSNLDRGGAISVESGSPIIENCTFVSNGLVNVSFKQKINCGIAIRATNTKTIIRNCVIEGSGDGDIEGVTEANIFNCYVSDGQFVGTNNCFSTMPMFKDLAGGDYRIDRRSPVGLDAGVTQPWMVGAVDLAGEPRVQNKSVDIGAFETFYPARGTMLMVR